MKDSEFDDFLKRARGEVPLPGSFRQGVWHRIESTPSTSGKLRSRLNGFVCLLARPSGASTAIAATVAMGVWLGVSSAPNSNDAEIAYAESISPFAYPKSK
jgi:hypothetical protein